MEALGRCACSLVGCAIFLQGCVAGSSGASGKPDSDASIGKTGLQAFACLGGAALGAFAAKALAASEGKRLKLSAADVAKRERGYLIGFALIGCAGSAVLAGTAYTKLSESGKRAREQELREAAASAKPRTYRDPERPDLLGTITPQAAYIDADKGRECRDVVDNLADAGKGEPVVVKMCRNVAGGGWTQVTA